MQRLENTWPASFFVRILFWGYTFLIILSPSGYGQQPVLSEKGAKPIQEQRTKNQEPTTYAVVVGISDYQDPDIPDLQYADRDALAYAGFLQSGAGGSLEADHLRILINEEATLGNFAMALDWLMEVTRQGDRAIIYFSGHGDVENTYSQGGFLLCWDAPSRVYFAGGTLGLAYFEDIIKTISLINKARVVVIADACRSGKLSGSSIAGARITNANLLRSYANELKILSCQPQEYSIEGDQWGGGRGAFSYHLVNGLYGLADANGDSLVNAMEVRYYLEEKVAREVAPLRQLPVTVGDGREILSHVDQALLAKLKASHDGELAIYSQVSLKSMENEVLEAAGARSKQLYSDFRNALKEKRYLEPAEDCAEHYYQQCLKDPSLEPLYPSITRNYAATLQDDAQQVMNRLLRSDPEENAKSFHDVRKEYGHYPDHLRMAAELLGENHYMYRPLMARSYWFEAYVKDESRLATYDPANAANVIPYYKKALEYQPDMPHSWLYMAAVYGIEMREIDSAEYYAGLAFQAVPGWTLVPYWVSYVYLNHYEATRQGSSLDKAEEWLEKGMALDSNSSSILDQLAYLYNLNGKYANEQAILDRSFRLDSVAMTQFYKGMGYKDWGKFEEAERAFLRAIQLDSSILFERRGLIALYCHTRQWDKLDRILAHPLIADGSAGDVLRIANDIIPYRPERALEYFLRAVEQDSTNAFPYTLIGLCHTFMENGDYREALKWHKKAVRHDPRNFHYHFHEGLIYVKWNEMERAEEKFQVALAADSSFLHAYAALFMLYYQNGEIEKAEAYLAKAMDGDPYSAPFIVAWAGHRYLQNPEAVPQIFRTMEELYPDNPHVHYGWAEYLMSCGNDKEGAFQQLEKALQKSLTDVRSSRLCPLRMETERWNALMQKYGLE